MLEYSINLSNPTNSTGTFQSLSDHFPIGHLGKSYLFFTLGSKKFFPANKSALITSKLTPPNNCGLSVANSPPLATINAPTAKTRDITNLPTVVDKKPFI